MITIGAGVKGFYRLTRYSRSGEVRQKTPWFDNLITDNGLDLLYRGNFLTNCYVSADSTPPVNADTTLSGVIASQNSVDRTFGVQIATAPYYVKQNASFFFNEGAAAGNIAKLAVGNDVGDLLSISLIKDELGNPVVITVEPDEFLRIEYEFRIYVPGEATGTVTVNGDTHTWRSMPNWVSRQWRLSGNGAPFDLVSGTSVPKNLMQAYEFGIGSSIDAPPSGSSTGSDALIALPYTAGDHETVLVGTFEPPTANFTSEAIKSIVIVNINLNPPSYKIEFTPGIPKTNLDRVKFTVRFSWSRA